MPKFFIDQRVRILWSNHWPELKGQEGRIVGGPDPSRTAPGSEPGDWLVAPDCWGTSLAPTGASTSGRFSPKSEQLEPILPEGHRPALLSYEELMNQCKEGTCLMPS